MKKIGLIILLFCSTIVFPQGKLKSAKDSFKIPDSGKYIVTESESQSSSSGNDESIGMYLLRSGLLELTFGLVYYVTVETPFERTSQMANAELEPYPFYHGNKGDYTYQAQNLQLWRLEASDSYFNETDRLQANDLRLKFRFLDRFSISGMYLHFWERPVRGQREQLDFVMTTVDYYRIRSPRFALYWGIGVGYIGNEVNETGFAMNVGSEFYVKPFSIDISYKFSLISDNYFGLFEIGPKYHLKQYFGQLKYQSYELGSQNVSGFSIGLGIYF